MEVTMVRGLTQVPRFFKVGQLAARLGVKTKTLRRWLDRGDFPNAIRPDGLWLVPEPDVLAFMHRHGWARRVRKGALAGGTS